MFPSGSCRPSFYVYIIPYSSNKIKFFFSISFCNISLFRYLRRLPPRGLTGCNAHSFNGRSYLVFRNYLVYK